MYSFWVLRPGESTATPLSFRCVGAGQNAISIADLGAQVQSQVRQLALAPRLGFQPAGGALTQLPTVFRTGQPTIIERTDSIAGFSVHFTARPTWTWSWGDGKSTTTTNPGGTWPDMSVTHTYTHKGSVRVIVEAKWDAEFTVEGEGPFPVSGAVTQNAAINVRIREARAELITQ